MKRKEKSQKEKHRDVMWRDNSNDLTKWVKNMIQQESRWKKKSQVEKRREETREVKRLAKRQNDQKRENVETKSTIQWDVIRERDILREKMKQKTSREEHRQGNNRFMDETKECFEMDETRWDREEESSRFRQRLCFNSHVKYYTEAKSRSAAPLGVMKCFCIHFHLYANQ